MYLVICSDKIDGFIYQTDGPFNSYAEASRYSRESACKNHHVIVDVEELRLICDNRIFAASRKPMS